MNNKEQRIAIATACGWKHEYIFGNGVDDYVYVDPSGKCWTDIPPHLPEYLTDLNAMHEAEKLLPDKDAYGIHLRRIVQQQSGEIYFKTFCATAAQRAEAFLRTLNLWKE